jgi:hypothetical protein
MLRTRIQHFPPIQKARWNRCAPLYINVLWFDPAFHENRPLIMQLRAQSTFSPGRARAEPACLGARPPGSAAR